MSFTKQFSSLLLILFSQFANAHSGGMIGGGEVSFKPQLTCQAQGIDPTHPSNISQVWVTKETHYDGSFVQGSTLRVVTMDSKNKPVNYYVTHDENIAITPGGDISLSIFRFENDPKRIGLLQWKDSAGTGTVKVQDGAVVEELSLSDCELHTYTKE